jgi:hypothetical protein
MMDIFKHQIYSHQNQELIRKYKKNIIYRKTFLQIKSYLKNDLSTYYYHK